MEEYINPCVTNAVATNTAVANSPKRVLKLPRPPEHPDGPGTVDIEVITIPLKSKGLFERSKYV